MKNNLRKIVLSYLISCFMLSSLIITCSATEARMLYPGGMPFGVKSLEKRQNELIARLFKPEERSGVNACRLVSRAFELRIIDVDHLEEDEE